MKIKQTIHTHQITGKENGRGPRVQWRTKGQFEAQRAHAAVTAALQRPANRNEVQP